VDLSLFPAQAVLRWDLTIRVVLAIGVPVALALILQGSYVNALAIGLTAVMVSLSSLGPDIGSTRWSVVAAVATPVAALVAGVTSQLATGGLLFVFLAYTAFGACAQAGIVAQMAWFPVATFGLLVAVVSTGTPTAGFVAATVVGSAWALLLIIVVPRLVNVPRLPIPLEATAPNTALLRSMLTRPSLRAWGFPLLLGSLSAALLLAADILTGGFRPYWAVFAFASVLGPIASKTRASAGQTVLATVLGLVLAAVLASLGMSALTLILVCFALLLPGALLMLRNGLLSKILLTPLPVIIVALLIDEDLTLVAGYRFGEYVFGALVGVLVAGVAEWLTQHMGEKQEHRDEVPVA
jgi:hypothetical protein